MPKEKQIYFRYFVVVAFDAESDMYKTYEYWCSKANAQFSEPRIKRAWKGKAIIYRIYEGNETEVVENDE